MRMFCFSYAGAGASAYRGWHEDFPPSVEICCVQTPGRENRIREKPMTRMTDLSEHVAGAIRPWLDRPFVFFGHSMGALVAFEVIRRLREYHSSLELKHLFVSAARAPQLPWPYPATQGLPESEFLAEVHRRYESVPGQVVEDKELRALVVPALRGDFEIVETYRYAGTAPLEAPISAFFGDSDPAVSESAMDAWRCHTTGAFRLHRMRGSHIFLQTARRELTSAVYAALAPPANEN